MLRCADVESNPGTFDNADKEFLSKLMDTNSLDACKTTANESLAELKDAIGDLRQQRAWCLNANANSVKKILTGLYLSGY
jgi:hypothetical protein